MATPSEWDMIYKTKDKFLDEVRAAYREALKELPEHLHVGFKYNAQDDLSLFSPWMNSSA